MPHCWPCSTAACGERRTAQSARQAPIPTNRCGSSCRSAGAGTTSGARRGTALVEVLGATVVVDIAAARARDRRNPRGCRCAGRYTLFLGSVGNLARRRR